MARVLLDNYVVVDCGDSKELADALNTYYDKGYRPFKILQDFDGFFTLVLELKGDFIFDD